MASEKISQLNPTVKIGSVEVGAGKPLAFIAGPCVIESAEHARKMAQALSEAAKSAGVPYIFKASYDKANRTSTSGFRGPGPDEGLAILKSIKDDFGLPVLTDVHSAEEAEKAGEVVDCIQIPALLSRQTDLLRAAVRTGKPVNVKKGQFLAPWDAKNILGKIAEEGGKNALLTERGVSFGYNRLVSDMTSLVIMGRFGVPIVFDATHSVQMPGGLGTSSGGNREFVAPLARAAVAVGIDVLFLEVHDNPEQAFCDGPNSLRLEDFEPLARKLTAISESAK